MNTAINAYTSNYGSSATPATRGEIRRGGAELQEEGDGGGGGREESEKRRDRERGLILQISVVCALIGLSRSSDPRVALGSNEVTRSNCRSDVPRVYVCIYTHTHA